MFKRKALMSCVPVPFYIPMISRFWVCSAFSQEKIKVYSRMPACILKPLDFECAILILCPFNVLYRHCCLTMKNKKNNVFNPEKICQLIGSGSLRSQFDYVFCHLVFVQNKKVHWSMIQLVCRMDLGHSSGFSTIWPICASLFFRHCLLVAPKLCSAFWFIGEARIVWEILSIRINNS